MSVSIGAVCVALTLALAWRFVLRRWWSEAHGPEPIGVTTSVAPQSGRQLAVYDLQDGYQLMRLPTGRAPQSVALASDGRTAYVHDFMDRQISRFDLTQMLEIGRAHV